MMVTVKAEVLCPGCRVLLSPEVVRCPHCGFCFRPMVEAITSQTVGRVVGGGMLRAECAEAECAED